MNLKVYKPKSSGLKKVVLFAGIIMVFLVIFSILITSGILGGTKVSEKQLIVGASFTMQENKSVKLEVGEEEHEIVVENVGEDWAEIVVRSEPLKFTLKVNEVIELDLDGDGQSDIRVKLFKIQDGRAVIAVKRIDKDSCVEDWVCEDWGGCADGKRIRECFDANGCGSEFFKPFNEQRCVGNNPVEINETEQIVKGMDDVVRTKEIDFSDNVHVESNMPYEEEDEISDDSIETEKGDYEENNSGGLNLEDEEENVSVQNVSSNIGVERVDDLQEEGLSENDSSLNNSDSDSNVDISLVH